MNTYLNIARSRALLALAIGAALLTVSACGGGDDQQQAPSAGTQAKAPADAAHGTTHDEASHGNVALLAGVVFAAPANWLDLGSSGMRQAQYRLDPVEGDAQQAEVNVFYFGPESGGGTEANLQRWLGQMSLPDGGDVNAAAERDQFTADGMAVSVISVDGTYQAGSMRPMGGGDKADPEPGYRLVGVVVEGPQGSLFFKLTGPAATARAMEADLLEMVRGAKKSTG